MKQKIIRGFWQYATLQTVLLNIAIALIYIISGKLGLKLAFTNPSATPVWPPTGIAFAAILFFGYRAVPAIFFGAFFVNSTTAGTILTSFLIALGNTGEALLGAYFAKKYANSLHMFESASDVFTFAFLTAGLSTVVSATIGVTALILGGLANIDMFWAIWITWWLGDMGGNLVIAPLLIVWGNRASTQLSYKQILHLSFCFVVLFIVTDIVFSGVLPYAYLIIPIAVWIAFWFGQRAATAATLFVASIAIFYTLGNTGPFANELSLNHSLLLVQMFLGIFSLTTLIFAATVQAMKKGEKTLSLHQERFRALIENSFDAVVLIDATSKIVYASPSVKRLIGYTPEEMQGLTGFDLVAHQDKKKTIRTLAQLVLKPKSVVTIEYRTIRKDNSIIWVEATGTNLLFEPGVNAIVVNFHDITEKKISQERILQEKMEDEAMLTSIGEGIIATDNKGKISMINQTACTILGWNEEELVGKYLVDTVPMQNAAGKTLDVSERPITNVLSSGKRVVTSLTNYYLKKDKTKIPVRFTVTPIILNGEVMGIIEVFDDITKEKEIDKAKNEFVSVASHQLRTPLTIINWYLEEIIKKSDNFDDQQKKYLHEIHLACRRMVDLINALLNASRLELGTFMVEPTKLELSTMISDVLKDMKPQIATKHIVIKKQYQKNLPLISADAKLLVIILQNLLSNAIKYNRDGGSVTISLAHSAKEFTIAIADTGIGIPENQHKHIFSKMFRADNARSIDPEGTGLGLYIVKAIVAEAGGDISFVSHENEGTTFSVSFPTPGMRAKLGQKKLS